MRAIPPFTLGSHGQAPNCECISRQIAIGSRRKPTPIDQEALISIQLALPARKAARIAELRGDFLLLRGGEIKETSIDHLLDRLGQPIEDPILKEAGVSISLGRDPKADTKVSDPSSLKVTINGKPVAIAKMEVCDDQNQTAATISGYRTPILTATAAERSFGLNRPLDNTMVLKIHVMIGQ
jgi:hypothetical protein